MSIILSGKTNGEWKGTWQYAKDKQAALNFRYEKKSLLVPMEMIRFLSFESDSFLMNDSFEDNFALQDNTGPAGSESMIGYWTGSFEVSGAQAQLAHVEESFFICGRHSWHGDIEIDPRLANLPAAPSFSLSALQRKDIAQQREETAKLGDNCADIPLFGFGRNEFGRFSIVLVNCLDDVIVAEKRYILSKSSASVLPRRKDSFQAISHPSRERERVRKKFDDELVPVDEAHGKRKNSDWSQRKSIKARSVMESQDSMTLIELPEEDEDFKNAFLDELTGEVYEGGWYCGVRHGHGVCLYADGTMFEGAWVFGREHGRGVLMTGSRQTIYIGDWSDGFMSGHGCYHYPNGDVYSGDWKEGLRHGRGEYSFSNGCRYVGDWKEGRRQGKGSFWWSHGSHYEGEWEHDTRHGRGILRTEDGYTYDGTWISNFMDGRGCCRYPDGQEYHGTFKLGLREGRGSINFPEGAAYEGRFREDRIDGQGTIKIEKTLAGSSNDEVLIPVQVLQISEVTLTFLFYTFFCRSKQTFAESI